MKKILALFLFLGVSFGLIACTSGNKDATKKESSVNYTLENEVEEKSEEDVSYNVDWEKCIGDTKNEFSNLDQYSYVDDMYIEVSNNKITFTAAISDSTDKEVALKFADSLIRRFNANAQLQDSSIKSSGKDYLGGLYDVYDIYIGVAPLSKINDSTEWYIHDVIGKKVHKELKLQK